MQELNMHKKGGGNENSTDGGPKQGLKKSNTGKKITCVYKVLCLNTILSQ